MRINNVSEFSQILFASFWKKEIFQQIRVFSSKDTSHTKNPLLSCVSLETVAHCASTPIVLVVDGGRWWLTVECDINIYWTGIIYIFIFTVVSTSYDAFSLFKVQTAQQVFSSARHQSGMATFGRYTHAIVCRVPNAFKEAVGLSAPVSLDEARRQHEAYVRSLRQLDVDVIELPADEKHPDCVFVEDCAVVCNGIALLCRPGHASRRGEVDAIRAVIKKELELPIVEVLDPKATLDGGDVLFTGREFFVGLSGRTNEAGAAAVAAAFPEFSCTPIRVPAGTLHLKTLVTMAGPDILAVSELDDAQTVLKRIEREATFRYQTLTVREPAAANCVLVNGTLIHRARSECPESCDVFEDRLSTNLHPVCISELAKADAGLTCCSILVRKSKRPQL
ncbi:N(G),N(G)-dimethylarginine dimethylaminohydrolase 1 [Amphibalanus amphitrite]|uniref:N(G),N(G)-dimethylarginine dimethylaminohydrolase 1 n=1 Tax=Amphibalanus amphitrite TaxID=1232801 RepID=A0A6A4X0B6_AMPAM|nr:N(G),N(G)-dimethylarginine dimethylaminohydrolase 1 [Amphibalanus amphitrite]